MLSYQAEEWFQIILKKAGKNSFLFIGEANQLLKKKFSTVGLKFNHLNSLNLVSSNYSQPYWFVEKVNDYEIEEELIPIVQKYQPSFIYFETNVEYSYGLREMIETSFFKQGYRKTSDYHQLIPFTDDAIRKKQYSFEKMPNESLVDFNNQYGFEQFEAGLHRDMLRDTGRRADAHTIRYYLASKYLRPHDIVLDAACGLGYGTSILAANSLCASAIGIDNSEYAIDYAKKTYVSSSKRVQFKLGDVIDLSDFADNSIHAVVSFETLEHLENPDIFLKECHRVLVPGGRFICSVPDNWADETGKDPNPYHFHVYNKQKLVKELKEYFEVEHTFLEKAGNGCKELNVKERLLVEVDKESIDEDGEWCLAVAMKSPFESRDKKFDLHSFPQVIKNPDIKIYRYPALEYAFILLGIRTDSHDLLIEWSKRIIKDDADSLCDLGAALCVLGYQYFSEENKMELEKLLPLIEKYIREEHIYPTQHRWRISLKFLLGKIFVEMGDTLKAKQAFLECGQEDCLLFGPTLGTKIIEALFLYGWLHYLDGNVDEATDKWKMGVNKTQGIFQKCDWNLIKGREELPFDGGFAEMMLILQRAQQCAFSIYAVKENVFEPNQDLFNILINSLSRNPINYNEISYLKTKVLDVEDFNEDRNFSQMEIIKVLRDQLKVKETALEKLLKKFKSSINK